MTRHRRAVYTGGRARASVASVAELAAEVLRDPGPDALDRLVGLVALERAGGIAELDRERQALLPGRQRRSGVDVEQDAGGYEVAARLPDGRLDGSVRDRLVEDERQVPADGWEPRDVAGLQRRRRVPHELVDLELGRGDAPGDVERLRHPRVDLAEHADARTVDQDERRATRMEQRAGGLTQRPGDPEVGHQRIDRPLRIEEVVLATTGPGALGGSREREGGHGPLLGLPVDQPEDRPDLEEGDAAHLPVGVAADRGEQARGEPRSEPAIVGLQRVRDDDRIAVARQREVRIGGERERPHLPQPRAHQRGPDTVAELVGVRHPSRLADRREGRADAVVALDAHDLLDQVDLALDVHAGSRAPRPSRRRPRPPTASSGVRRPRSRPPARRRSRSASWPGRLASSRASSAARPRPRPSLGGRERRTTPPSGGTPDPRRPTRPRDRPRARTASRPRWRARSGVASSGSHRVRRTRPRAGPDRSRRRSRRRTRP